MAKKKKQQYVAPPMTRGQLSRAQKQKQQERNLYAAIGGVLVLAVLVLGFAVLNTTILQPNAEVASVNGTKINRATYNKLRRWDLFQQIQQSVYLSQQGGSASSGTTDPATLQAQLASVDTDPLDSTTVGELVDSEVLKQAAKKDYSLSPSTDDLKKEALKDFIPQPTPPSTQAPSTTPTSAVTGTPKTTPTATATATVGSPTQTPTITPTLPPVPGASATAEAGFGNYVKAIGKGTAPDTSSNFCSYGCPGLSESDYLNLVITPRLLQNDVTDKLASTIVTQVEEIHAQHILTDTEAGAKKIIDELNKGADFTQLANTQSSEQLNNIKNGQKPNGGDLGWFPKQGSSYDQTFVDGAWPVQAGHYTTAPVKTQFGYHVIKVLERDPHRQLSDSDIATMKQQKYTDWFTKAKASANITSKAPSQAVPTQPPALQGTTIPVPQTTPPADTPVAPPVATTPTTKP